MGLMATMLPGVRPNISFASLPTASTSPVTLLMATIEGSFTTIPLPRAYTRVLAVPRSMARSLEKMLNSERRLWLRVGPEWYPLFDMTKHSVWLQCRRFRDASRSVAFLLRGDWLHSTGIQPTLPKPKVLVAGGRVDQSTTAQLLNNYLLLLRIHATLRGLRSDRNNRLSGRQRRRKKVESAVRVHHW